MRVAAQFFDGRNATAHAASISSDGLVLDVECEGRVTATNLADVRVVPPVGQGIWAVDLPDGSRVTFDNADFGDLVSARQGGREFVGILEGSWRWALVSLIVVVVGTFAILTWGLPAAARHVAFAIPPSVETTLRTEGLGALDRVLFDPSRLDSETRARVTALFEGITAARAEYASYRLVFRSSNVGPNAFVLPGGLIVMTDEMVELAESDDELTAVLAHEVGHQAHRHLMRMVLQNSVGALLVATLTGDLTSVTALAASVPTAVMQAKFSRDFEREADAFAFDYLESQGRDPGVLRELLQRLERRAGAGGGNSWFASHPAAGERAPE
jgi:Zn-dependent protease with chaperone function